MLQAIGSIQTSEQAQAQQQSLGIRAEQPWARSVQVSSRINVFKRGASLSYTSPMSRATKNPGAAVNQFTTIKLGEKTYVST